MRRRDFVKLGTGVLIACRVDPAWAWQGRGESPRINYPTDYRVYFHFGNDGRITCYVGRVEMGQGNMTSLAQIAADGLGVDVDALDMVMGDTARCPWDMGTFGSMSVPVFGPVLRRAAEEARAVYREFCAEAAIVPAVAMSESVGRSAPRRDATAKVTGRAEYAADVRLPGMLYAKIVRPPAHGAALARVDAAAAAAVPGATIIQESGLVAVLHERPDEAARARELITAKWDLRAPSIDDGTIYRHLIEAAPPGDVLLSTGDVRAAERDAAFTIETVYRNAYVAHAPIETHAALANVDDAGIVVWVSTQAPFMVRTQVAQALGVAVDRVRVITPFVGGGFGGKVTAQQAVEAATLARRCGHPVQVMWDREEEFFFDAYRPAAVMTIRSAVDAAGRIVSWDADIVGAGEGGATPTFYRIANQHIVARGSWQANSPGFHPFGVGAWRAPAVNSNTFAREVQIDAIAARVGVDAVRFRRDHISDQRMQRVLETAARRFGWREAASPSGRGVGVACGVYSGTCVATCAEVAVDAPDRVRVKRVVCAQDMGQAVNPDGARRQMEGCMTMGLGYALGERVRFADGAILDRNFDTYGIPRFSWLPEIETVLVDSPGHSPTAGGEPAIINMGAVIANAVHDATGGLVRDLPIAMRVTS